MKSRQSGLTQETSAAKADISVRTGRRIEKNDFPINKQRHWKTRADPFESVWDSKLVPLLINEPTLTGLTLWEYLDEHYPQTYPYSLLRTLQRRVKHWKATQGPYKPVMFRQSMPAGQQGLSDFTHPNTDITIAGKPFKHMIYQFRLAYSGWRYAHIIQGGESYSALSEGLQNALHQLGGVPIEHRTDSLTAAYVNNAQHQQLTRAYEALCQHYNLIGTTNNLGVSHENGAVETAHGSLKHRLSQAIKLRGSCDFASIADYQVFINRSIERLNRYSVTRLQQEQNALQVLPDYRFMDYTECTVKVTTSSTISIKRGLYTVPSRLIGENLTIHLYHNKLRGFVGQTPVFELNRVFPDEASGRARRIDYHHVIHSLAAKPQAFRYSNFRDELFPDDNFRQLWGLVDQQLSSRDACKWMVMALRIAAVQTCELELGLSLLKQAQEEKLPDLKQLQSQYLEQIKLPPENASALQQHNINHYDSLLSGHWAHPSSEGETYVS